MPIPFQVWEVLVIELMGYDWYTNLVHIPYGLVSLEGAELSSRNGNIIYAEDILNEAVKRAAESIEEKNPQLADKETVARKVGIGAVIFHDLFNQRMKNVDFSWDDVLNFEGTTGPYVQYTYARAKSILRKSSLCQNPSTQNVYEVEASVKNISICHVALTDDITFELVKVLSGYEEAVMNAACRYEPSIIARYIIAVAASFNKFYHECTILREENESVKFARLKLVNVVQGIISEACSLLGMECPEEM